MATITLHSVKGGSLTNDEVDANWNNINQELVTKVSQSELTEAIDSLTDEIESSSSDLTTLINSKIANSAGSVSNTNYASQSITYDKISQISQAWTFVGSISLTGSFVASGNISGVNISGTSGSFTNLTATGPTNLGTIVATSINGTPIGNIVPSTGVFTTLSATSISGSLTGSFSGTAVLATNSTAITQDASDSSNKIATTGWTQIAGKNSQGNKTISTSAPSGGSDGDIWYQY